MSSADGYFQVLNIVTRNAVYDAVLFINTTWPVSLTLPPWNTNNLNPPVC